MLQYTDFHEIKDKVKDKSTDDRFYVFSPLLRPKKVEMMTIVDML